MKELIIKKSTITLLIAFATLFILYLSYMLVNIIIIFIIAVLLGFIFAPFVRMLEGLGLSRSLSTLSIFIVFGLLVYLGLSYVIPQLVYQMNQLIVSLKDFSLKDELNIIEKKILGVFPLFTSGELSAKVQALISKTFNDTINHLTIYLSNILSILAILVIVPFISFFLLKDTAQIQKYLIHKVPNKYFEPSYWIFKRVTLQLGRFVRGWIFDATFVGVALGFGFYLIGLPNSLPLGVIAGLGHLIPYFGPLIGGVPAAIISIIQTGDLSQIPLIMLIITITYTLDNGFVQPYVFSKSVDMHPIIIILLIIAGSQLFGLIGMLLAVPVTTVVKTAVTEIYFALKNYKIVRT